MTSQEENWTPPRQLTVDEAVALAIALQKSELCDQAEDLYRQIFEIAPNHPNALHFAGVLAHQRGQGDKALDLIERSLALEPDRADWHSNHGNILQNRGALTEAVAAYERAIALDPNHANAHSNLGVLLRALGKPGEAEAAYRTAIRLNPSHIDAHTNLGVLLHGQKRFEESVACFCRVITLSPKNPDARRLLALAHCTVGEVEKAVTIYEDWLVEEPGAAIPRHMLAACSGRNVPTRASDSFVEEIFDNFAASFDSKLAKLSYRAPNLVAAMVEGSHFEPAKSLEMLDAGCGTGLCGPLLAPYARHMTGVDLSAGMLAQAKEKNVYDNLVKGELTEFLRDHRGAFDLIVSADTLVYFGALEEVVANAASALRPGGAFVFTLEASADGEPGETYRLGTHGRYSHSQTYVERLLNREGLAAEIDHAELRLEAGTPVAGLVVRSVKPFNPEAVRAPVSSVADTLKAHASGEHDA